jgi:hypothetical protein
MNALRDHYRYRQYQKWQSACRQVGRLQKIKQELVMVTWHPERFMDWCLSYMDK